MANNALENLIFYSTDQVTIKNLEMIPMQNGLYKLRIVCYSSANPDGFDENYCGLSYDECKAILNKIKVGQVFNKITGFANL